MFYDQEYFVLYFKVNLSYIGRDLEFLGELIFLVYEMVFFFIVFDVLCFFVCQ